MSTSKKENPYTDIIDLPRHRSQYYPPMPREKRAAQFSPFAALSGHEEAIKEKARLTEQKIELSESKKAQLSARLLLLEKHLEKQPIISITYFVPDEQKSGGTYVTKTGVVTKIVEHARSLIFKGEQIPLADIISLEGELFDTLFLQP